LLLLRCSIGYCHSWQVASAAAAFTALANLVVRRYLTNMTTTVSTKGQIVLPAEIRVQDDIEPGQQFDVERIDRGEYRLVRRQPPANEGLVDWLLACPEKDFLAPIESESTDTL
jgi:AbrB family looped-hinge helix DNA binding protein